MGHTADLLNGLAADLAAAGIGVFHDAAYAPGDTGIGIGELPESCDRAIAIADYLTAADNPGQPVGVIGVQFWFRGGRNDRDSMTDLRDAVFQHFQGMTHRQFGGYHLIQMRRVSSLSFGRDGNGRWECADNYYLDGNTPPTPNRNQ
jgi:hypothetical protein